MMLNTHSRRRLSISFKIETGVLGSINNFGHFGVHEFGLLFDGEIIIDKAATHPLTFVSHSNH